MESKLKIDVVPYNSNDGKNENKQEDEKSNITMSDVSNTIDRKLDEVLSQEKLNNDSKFASIDNMVTKINNMEHVFDNKTKELDDMTKRALTLITAKG